MRGRIGTVRRYNGSTCPLASRMRIMPQSHFTDHPGSSESPLVVDVARRPAESAWWRWVGAQLWPPSEPPRRRILDPLGLRVSRGKGWNNGRILAGACILGVSIPSIHYAANMHRLPRGFLIGSIIAAVAATIWLIIEWRRKDPERRGKPTRAQIRKNILIASLAFFLAATLTFGAFGHWLLTGNRIGIAIVAIGFFLVSGLHAWLRHERRRLRVTWTDPVTLRFTAFGFFHSALTLVVGMLALQTGFNLLIGIFGVMLTLIIVSGLFTSANFHLLRVKRIVPPEIHAGQPTRLTMIVTNGKRWLPSYSVWLQEAWPEGVPEPAVLPSVYALSVPPRSEVKLSYSILFPKRGVASFAGFTCMTRFPFSLFGRYRYFSDTQEILVLPEIRPLPESWRPKVSATMPMASQPRPTGRGTDDFRGLRPYVPGDSINAIHWPTSARLGLPMVRELDRETATPQWVVLELDYAGDRLEQAIVMAASLIHDAFAARIPFTLVIPPNAPVGPPAADALHRHACLDALARIVGFKPNDPDPPALREIRAAAMVANGELWAMPAGTAVVAVTTQQRPEFALAVQRRIPRGSSIAVLSAESAPSSAPPPKSADLPFASPPTVQPAWASTSTSTPFPNSGFTGRRVRHDLR